MTPEILKAIDELADFISYAPVEHRRANYAGMMNSPARDVALTVFHAKAKRKVKDFAIALLKEKNP